MHCARHANPAVIPANAGIHSFRLRAVNIRPWAFGQWIRAFAGMTRIGALARIALNCVPSQDVT